jgi:adenine phosphoribosyltransferase
MLEPTLNPGWKGKPDRVVSLVAMERLRAKIRDVPDFPKKGIVFKDLTPALADPLLFREVLDAMHARWRHERVAKVVGIESRGFIFGAPLAYLLGVGFTPLRKPGKLPYQRIQESYDLEYGKNVLEMHVDAIAPGDRVLVVDDLLATGGTAEAAGRLVRRQEGELVGYCFVVELAFLGGAKKLGNAPVHSLLKYEAP